MRMHGISDECQSCCCELLQRNTIANLGPPHGADGLNSSIRKQLLNDGSPTYRGHTCWRGVAHFDAPQLSGETWGRGQRFGFIPLGRDRVGWWATANMPANSPDLPQGRKFDVIERFRNWHFPIREILEATPDDGFLRNDICDRSPTTAAQRWSNQAVTLLGDAAHPTTPNLGQGACMAIEDALMLALCIQAGESIPRALERYEACRRDRTAKVTRQSLTLGNVAQWSNPFACAARDLAAHLMPDFVMQRQFREMWMYEVE
jgi:2-polyprenyl-6-methoxyphenol hydroxylase-like FAD-dependent oxidoreductase